MSSCILEILYCIVVYCLCLIKRSSMTILYACVSVGADMYLLNSVVANYRIQGHSFPYH